MANCPHEYIEVGKKQRGRLTIVTLKCVYCKRVKTMRWMF